MKWHCIVDIQLAVSLKCTYQTHVLAECSFGCNGSCVINYKVKRIRLEIDKSKDQDSARRTMRYLPITPIIANEPNHVFYFCKLQLITSPTDLRDSTTHTFHNAFSVERIMFIDSIHIYDI